MDSVFCRWGVPSQLHSDMEAQFFRKSVIAWALTNTHTTPYHLQCDGLVGHLNRTILATLETMVNDHGESWKDHLAKVCFTYNTSINSSTDYTPFYMMHGREARIDDDIDTQPVDHGQVRTCRPSTINN